MSNGIKALFHSTESIGLWILNTKVSYTWKILLNSKETTIVVLISKISSKIVVLLNGVIIHSEKKNKKLFTYDFVAHGYNLSIIESVGFYDLYIEGLSFLVMYKRQASSVIPSSDSHSFVVSHKDPLIYAEVHQKELENWEKKAKTFRLKFRTIAKTTVREKLPIKTHSLLRLDQEFSKTSQKALENAPTNHNRFYSFDQTTRSSNSSEKLLSIGTSMKKKHMRNHSRVMNFFLL